MREDPRKAWKAIRQIEKGSFAHHPPDHDVALEDPNAGIAAAAPKKTLRIIADHHHTLFNRDDAPVHWPALDDTKGCDVMPELGTLPTLEEMNAATQSLANNKAPGTSGPPAEALKALPSSTQATTTLPLIHRFWSGDYTMQHCRHGPAPTVQSHWKTSADAIQPPATTCDGILAAMQMKTQWNTSHCCWNLCCHLARTVGT